MSDSTDARGGRWRYRLAAVACLVWFVYILYETVRSANPPIVSRPQVLAAASLVEGTLKIENGSRRIVVDKVLFSRRGLSAKDFPAEGVAVTGRTAPWQINGAKAFAPLMELGPRDYAVQQIPFDVVAEADVAPIYPATPGVERQLNELLPAAKGGS